MYFTKVAHMPKTSHRQADADLIVQAKQVFRNWEAISCNGSGVNDIRMERLIRSLFSVFGGQRVKIEPKVSREELEKIRL
jgi:hypothetical protein